jgi:hypothetical protein
MAPRITMNTTPDGELEIWLNQEGRDLLVRELTGLSETRDHFHLGTFEGAEVAMRAQPYRQSDTILHTGTVLLRPDEWDRINFPHVIEDPS